MRIKNTASLALALVALAGWVDAVGYLQMGHLFVSFMSGNSTQLGVGIGHGDWLTAAQAAMIVALFVLGTFAGTLLALSAGKWHLPVVLFAEASILGVALLLPHTRGELSPSVAAMTLAMGLQNAALHTVNRHKVSLTYVTGTLVRLGQELAERVARRGQPGEWVSDLLFWLALVAGAVAGSLTFAWLDVRSLIVPLVGTLTLAVLAASTTSRGVISE